MRRNAMASRIGNGVGVFLDRDGVINEEVHLLSKPEQIRLIPGAAAGILRLNQVRLPVIVVTNQSVVARGMCTERELDDLHDALRALLWAEGARLDAIYYCPHHRDAYLEKYRVECPDRKPGVGLLRKAADEFNLNLSDCFIVGDQSGDVQAGINAGCRTLLVETGFAGCDGKYNVKPDHRCRDLAEAAIIILESVGVSLGEK